MRYHTCDMVLTRVHALAFLVSGCTGLDQATLLWVAMAADAEGQHAAAFAAHCHVRHVDGYNLTAALQLSGSMTAVCFEFDHVDSDGLKLVSDTKIRFPSTPVLMLTQQHSAEIVLWALRTRVFDVLLKPAANDEIRRCIERLQAIMSARRRQSPRTVASSRVVLPGEARHRTKAVKARLQAIAAYIAKNYTQPINETELARQCEMSPFHFSREFRKAFGITFRDQVCDLRLKEAARLLRNPGIPITDIAALAGFNDPSYFARAFRKRTGCVPSEYRKRLLARNGSGAPAATDHPPSIVTSSTVSDETNDDATSAELTEWSSRSSNSVA